MKQIGLLFIQPETKKKKESTDFHTLPQYQRMFSYTLYSLDKKDIKSN